jgi:transcriptional regulator
MYLPKHFEQNDPAALQALMHEQPLATLVVNTPAGLDANLIPLEYDASAGPHGTLRGHVARANPLWKQLAAAPEALALFHGAQAYISPNWYPSKQQHGKAVPTWNYVVVEARGPLHAIDDPVWLRALVERLTRRHENGQPRPWQVNDAPADFTQQMLHAIVGIEMPLTALTGKWKATQNRPEADRLGVAAGLAGVGAEAMSKLVRG